MKLPQDYNKDGGIEIMYCPYFECVHKKECAERECDTLECEFYGCNSCEMICYPTCPGIEMQRRKRTEE